MLTDKTKEGFKKWYIKYLRKERLDYYIFSNKQLLRKFYRKTIAGKIGVYQLFFDSVGIDIRIHKNFHGFFSNVNGETTYKGKGVIRGIESREQAWIEAIKEANNIYNKRK